MFMRSSSNIVNDLFMVSVECCQVVNKQINSSAVYGMMRE